MLQMQSSEITLLERPNVEKNSKAPVIQLAPGFMIDDSILEKPTLLIGQVSVVSPIYCAMQLCHEFLVT